MGELVTGDHAFCHRWKTRADLYETILLDILDLRSGVGWIPVRNAPAEEKLAAIYSAVEKVLNHDD